MYLDIDTHQYKELRIMSRVQLALNVSNINTAVDFYSQLFSTEPAKRRPGYANFAIANPPLKLVLIENPPAAGQVNHLGVEVESSEQIAAASNRFQETNLTVKTEDQTTCCYALQDKVWVKDPDGAAWEVYTVLEDSETFGSSQTTASGVCCA
jgi:catechol-2,3-dioxygenase